MMMSHSSATVAPSPTAWPFTLAMIGLSPSSIRNTIRRASGMPQCGVVDLFLHGDDVAARGKGAAGAGQDNDVHPGIVVDVIPDAGHRVVHGTAERIQVLRRVQGDGQNLSLPFNQQSLVLGIVVGPWHPVLLCPRLVLHLAALMQGVTAFASLCWRLSPSTVLAQKP